MYSTGRMRYQLQNSFFVEGEMNIEPREGNQSKKRYKSVEVQTQVRSKILTVPSCICCTDVVAGQSQSGHSGANHTPKYPPANKKETSEEKRQ